MNSTIREEKSIYSQLTNLVLHPTDFFKSVKSEHGWQKPVIWSAVSLLIFSALSILLFLFARPIVSGFPTIGTSLDFSNEFLFLLGLGFYWFFWVASLITVSITHFFIVKLGGKGSRDDTIKAQYYPDVLLGLFGWIPVLSVITLFAALYSYYRGFRILHSLSRGRAIVSLFVPYLVITGVGLLLLLALLLLAVIVLLLIPAW